MTEENLNRMLIPTVKMEHLEFKVEDDIETKLVPPPLKMELLEIKEEPYETIPMEHEIWGGVKQEPKVEITIEENMVELPKEVADYTMPDMPNVPSVVIHSDTKGKTVPHNKTSPDSQLQLSLNVKPSTLSDCNVPSGHQYCRDTVKKKKKTSTIQSTAIKMRLHETYNSNKPFSQYEILNSTEKTLICDTIKAFTCDCCHKCFSTLHSLKSHKSIHTASKPCDTYLQCLTTQSDLKKPARIHTESKHHTCETCHKCFRQSATLKSHIRIHTGIKPYTCDTCLKSFSHVSNFIKHLRTHTGSKPYTCDTCHKCFSDLSNLKAHIRLHTGRKPYTCKTCNKCFSQPSHLKTHIRIHTGSKPYTCETCLQCFTTQSDLKKHKRLHTGSKPYSCDTCHKCFSNTSNLKRHTSTHTGEQNIHL